MWCCPLLISTKTWEKLSADQQQLLLECAQETVQHQREENLANYEAELADLKANGMEVNEVDKAAFQAAIQPLYDTYAGQFGDTVEKIRAVKPESVGDAPQRGGQEDALYGEKGRPGDQPGAGIPGHGHADGHGAGGHGTAGVPLDARLDPLERRALAVHHGVVRVPERRAVRAQGFHGGAGPHPDGAAPGRAAR